jgi:hypothetical protein
MKKQVALYLIMCLLAASCGQQKNERPNQYNKEEKKKGCGCSSENILDLRASEHPSESLANPTAKL